MAVKPTPEYLINLFRQLAGDDGVVDSSDIEAHKSELKKEDAKIITDAFTAQEKPGEIYDSATKSMFSWEFMRAVNSRYPDVFSDAAIEEAKATTPALDLGVIMTAMRSINTAPLGDLGEGSLRSSSMETPPGLGYSASNSANLGLQPLGMGDVHTKGGSDIDLTMRERVKGMMSGILFFPRSDHRHEGDYEEYKRVVSSIIERQLASVVKLYDEKRKEDPQFSMPWVRIDIHSRYSGTVESQVELSLQPWEQSSEAIEGFLDQVRGYFTGQEFPKAQSHCEASFSFKLQDGGEDHTTRMASELLLEPGSENPSVSQLEAVKVYGYKVFSIMESRVKAVHGRYVNRAKGPVQDNALQGNLEILFIVNSDGSVRDVKVTPNGINDEAFVQEVTDLFTRASFDPIPGGYGLKLRMVPLLSILEGLSIAQHLPDLHKTATGEAAPPDSGRSPAPARK